MKFLKEADKIALYKRALYDIEILSEQTSKVTVTVSTEGVMKVVNHTEPATFSSMNIDWDRYTDANSLYLINGGLSSLNGFPQKFATAKWVSLDGNPFKSLEGISSEFSGELNIDNCDKLQSLEHCPPNISALSVDGCYSLEDFVGCPTELKSFSALRMKGLKNLKGLPKVVREWMDIESVNSVELDCDVQSCNTLTLDLQRTDLKNIHKAFKRVVNLTIYDDKCKIAGHILGLVLIKDLREVILQSGSDELFEAIEIVNKFLPNNRDYDGMFDCQEALEEAGLDQFAKL